MHSTVCFFLNTIKTPRKKLIVISHAFKINLKQLNLNV